MDVIVGVIDYRDVDIMVRRFNTDINMVVIPNNTICLISAHA